MGAALAARRPAPPPLAWGEPPVVDPSARHRLARGLRRGGGPCRGGLGARQRGGSSSRHRGEGPGLVRSRSARNTVDRAVDPTGPADPRPARQRRVESTRDASRCRAPRAPPGDRRNHRPTGRTTGRAPPNRALRAAPSSRVPSRRASRVCCPRFAADGDRPDDSRRPEWPAARRGDPPGGAAQASPPPGDVRRSACAGTSRPRSAAAGVPRHPARARGGERSRGGALRWADDRGRRAAPGR